MESNNQQFFELPLTETPAQANEPTRIMKSDLVRWKSLSPAVDRIQDAFGARECEMQIFGDKLRVYIPEAKGDAPAFEMDVPGVLRKTADQLTGNCIEGHNLPLDQAVDSPKVAALLRTCSALNHRSGRTPTFHNSTGAHEVPILSAQLFIQENQESSRRVRSGTFCIVGARRNDQGRSFICLSQDRIDVAVGEKMLSDISIYPISVLLSRSLWFEGSITKAEDGVWVSDGECKVVMQEQL